MKVLHFSSLDGQTGAGVAAARIHDGLLAHGVTSRFCVAYPSGRLKNAFTPQVTLAGRVKRSVLHTLDTRRTAKATAGYDYVLSTGALGIDIGRIVEAEKPDIVQLHWIGGSAFKLASLAGVRVPVVWRLSDQWPFCGLQHLEPDAATYTSPPPARMSLAQAWSDPSEHVRMVKAATYRTIKDLVLACPSRWIAAEAGRSALLGDRPIELIPTSCDTTLFAPNDKSACRKALRLDPDKDIVLVGATSMATRWKGLDLFVEAMAGLAPTRAGKRPLQIVTFGHDAFDAPALKGLVEVVHLGPVADRRMMAMLYCAADVYVAPSRMENLSNAVLEALACATPVVAFDIGGMPDMIDHQGNGFLAAAYEPSRMGEGIGWVLDQQQAGDTLAVAARRKVLDSFSVDGEINRYIALYERLLHNGKPKPAD